MTRHHAADEPSLTFRVCFGIAFFLILGGCGIWAFWAWFDRAMSGGF